MNSAREEELIRISVARYEKYMKRLEADLARDIAGIVQRMNHIWGLSRMAFNKKLNAELRFYYSQQLALAHGVSRQCILKNEEEIDCYFLK